MLHKTRGIVLHYVRYGETSIIAHIYTELFGRQSYIINNVRSKRSSFSLNYFQPLTILDIEAYFKPNRDIQRIKEIKRHVSLDQIYSDITKSSITIFIAEVIYKTLREAEANPSMFNFLNHSIQFLDLMNRGISNFHLIFLIQYSKYLGIFPQIQLDQLNEKIENERFAEHLIEETLFSNLSEEARKKLSELTRKSFHNLENISINPQIRIELLDKLVAFYILHFENIGQINSLKVLKEIFH
jgi:DNA repair protein RecO (recombination protein O)